MVKKWLKGTLDGQSRIGILIYEVSRVRRRGLELLSVDRQGALLPEGPAATEFDYICLNEGNPTFVPAEPAIKLDRDKQRFHATFWVDGNRRLLVTVVDHLNSKVLLEGYPVVRL
ncbi:MAG: hypothetical protein HYR60_32285 [Acidobacteria bacterium]|nr:hypothetical protein [Acidobacteriota bacterium]